MEFLLVLIALIGGLAVVTGIIFGSTIVYGITLSVLWGWFISPVFGLPPLTIPEAIGLSLVVGYLTRHLHPDPKPEAGVEPKTKEEQKEVRAKFWAKLFAPLIQALSVLFFGWVVHHFFM